MSATETLSGSLGEGGGRTPRRTRRGGEVAAETFDGEVCALIVVAA